MGRAVILVEGTSDKSAIEALAIRRGRALDLDDVPRPLVRILDHV